MSYDTTIGRFLEEDPEGYNEDGLDLYQLERSNPLNRTDPTGTVSVGIVNPNAHGGAGAHAFIVVDTPTGPMVYSFQPPDGWYGPTPLIPYIGGCPPNEDVRLYPLPGLNDGDLDKYLKAKAKNNPHAYASGGEICSTETAEALENLKLPNDLQGLLDEFLSFNGVKGPSTLEQKLLEYMKNHNLKPTTLAPSGTISGSSSSSSS